MDNDELGRKFRKHFVEGLRRLVRQGKLRLEGEWSWLQDPTQREAWLDELTATDWNVFIEGPPHGKSQPTHVLKVPGSLHDRRPDLRSPVDLGRGWRRDLLGSQQRQGQGNKSEPFPLRGTEFVRRWSMHILPKGYTRSRSYGGYHCGSRAKYLELCRKLLPATQEDESTQQSDLTERPEPSLPKCDRCQAEMVCVASSPRPSWREVFTVGVYRDQVYSPTLHIDFGNLPQAHPIGGYG